MEWSEAWQMKFNVNKCKVMHYGFNNPSYEYLMNGEVLTDTEEERDLGVSIMSKWVNKIHLCWDVVIDPHLVMKSMIQNCFQCCQIYYLFIIKTLLYLVISITPI